MIVTDWSHPLPLSRSATSESNRGVIILAANSSWNIFNYRRGLVRALKSTGYEPILVAPAEPASAELVRSLEVEHIPIEISRSGMNPIADARLVLAYRKILRTIRPRAFLSFTIKPNIYGSLAARMTGVTAFANISGLGTPFANDGLLQKTVSRLYRLSLAKNAVVYFQNSVDQEVFVDRSLVRREQAQLLPGSGIDLKHFSVQPLPSGPPKFLLVTRLLADKGVRQYVEAARILRVEFPDARFQLLGPLDDGNPTAISPTELYGWIAEEVIEYLGETEDVRPNIQAASVVVLPSYYREGVPHILLEAAAMGRPCITTDTAGCREAVEDGKTGFLCAERSIPSLTDAMARMLALSPAFRQAMGRAARRKMEDQFGEEIVHHAYLDALTALI